MSANFWQLARCAEHEQQAGDEAKQAVEPHIFLEHALRATRAVATPAVRGFGVATGWITDV